LEKESDAIKEEKNEEEEEEKTQANKLVIVTILV